MIYTSDDLKLKSVKELTKMMETLKEEIQALYEKIRLVEEALNFRRDGSFDDEDPGRISKNGYTFIPSDMIYSDHMDVHYCIGWECIGDKNEKQKDQTEDPNDYTWIKCIDEIEKLPDIPPSKIYTELGDKYRFSGLYHENEEKQSFPLAKYEKEQNGTNIKTKSKRAKKTEE